MKVLAIGDPHGELEKINQELTKTFMDSQKEVNSHKHKHSDNCKCSKEECDCGDDCECDGKCECSHDD